MLHLAHEYSGYPMADVKKINVKITKLGATFINTRFFLELEIKNSNILWQVFMYVFIRIFEEKFKI